MLVTRIGFLNNNVLDETEFDTSNEAEAMALFSDFCKENNLVNPKVEYIEVGIGE